MAHFSQIENNIVTNLIVIDNVDTLDSDGIESEAVGVQFCSDLLGGTWVQTSYNEHFRKNFGIIGRVYDEDLDAFYDESPRFYSWVFNRDTCQWEPPVPMPTDGKGYAWSELTNEWVVFSEVKTDGEN